MSRKHPQFGDIVENGWASDKNPLKRLVFLRVVRRTGKFNPGTFYECTNTKDGRHHLCASDRMKVIGKWPQDAHLIGEKAAMEQSDD